MSFRRKNNLPEISEIDKVNNAPDVLATIKSLGIPPEMMVVVGGSALALLELDRRAHDVDLALHPDVLREIGQHQQLPNGIPTEYAPDSRPISHHFYAKTSPLPIDIFPHNLGAYGDSTDFPSFINHHTIPSKSGLQVVDPLKLYLRKRSGFRMAATETARRQKLAFDKYDAVLLDRYMKDHRPIQF